MFRHTYEIHTNNSSFQNYSHPDDHTIRTTDTPGLKPFTISCYFFGGDRNFRGVTTVGIYMYIYKGSQFFDVTFRRGGSGGVGEGGRGRYFIWYSLGPGYEKPVPSRQK